MLPAFLRILNGFIAIFYFSNYLTLPQDSIENRHPTLPLRLGYCQYYILSFLSKIAFGSVGSIFYLTGFLLPTLCPISWLRRADFLM